MTDFIFLGSKITADGDCSHGIKRHLSLVKKALTNLDSILKSRDITWPTKAHLIKAIVFPVVTYGCERWTVKKPELEALMLLTVVLEKTPKSPLDSKKINTVNPKGNQSWIFIRRTDCWSWSSHTSATWWEELTHWKSPWCWEWLKAAGEGDNRGLDGWMASLTWWTWVWARELVMDRETWHAAVHGVTKNPTWLSD